MDAIEVERSLGGISLSRRNAPCTDNRDRKQEVNSESLGGPGSADFDR